MKRIALFLCLTGTIAPLMNGQDRDQRIADLERQLTEARGSVAALQKTIESLSAEVQALHQPEPKSAVATTGAAPVKEGGGEKTDAAQDFTARIIGAENGSNEHDNELNAKPETFIQTRYSVAPVD